MRIERRVLDLGVGLVPVDALCMLSPEAVGIGERVLVHYFVLGFGDEGARLPLGRNFVNLVRHLVLQAHTARRGLTNTNRN